MKCNVNRLLSLVLALVMLVGILPLTVSNVAAASNDYSTMNLELYSNNFDEAIPSFGQLNADAELDDSVANTENSEGKSLKLTYKGDGTENGSTYKTPQNYFYYYGDFKAGNTYTLRVWYKASHSFIKRLFRVVYYTYDSSTSKYTSLSGNIQYYNTVEDSDLTGTVLELTYTPDSDCARIMIMLGATGLWDSSTSTKGSVWYDNLVLTETWTVENALTYGKETITLTEDTDLTSFTQTEGGEAGVITIAAGQTLDLNGYTLKATSVTVEKGGQLIDSTDGKGRVKASVNGNGANTYLPVEVNEREYIMVDPQITDKYITWVNNTDDTENPGFKIALRPGFGKYYDGDVEKSVRYDILASGGGDVSLKFSVAWADVYGQTGEADVYAASADAFQKVYSSTTGKYFYASFTNPGDSQYYNVTVSLIASGFVVSNTVAFENKPEADKTYLFAHNFENSLEWKGDNANTLYSLRDTSRYITYAYAAPTFVDGTLIMNAGDTANQLNLYLNGIRPNNAETLVIEMDVRIISAWTKNSNGIYVIVRNNGSSAGTSQYRQQRSVIIPSNSSQVKVYDASLPATAGASNDCTLTLAGSPGYITMTDGKFTTLRIVYDFTNYGTTDPMSVTVTIDGENPVAGVLQDFTYGLDYVEFLRNACQDGVVIDSLKMWYTN